MLEIYRTFARYNRWMNQNLYAACAGFTDEARKLERGVPFHSIHGNLNHVLLADQIWLGRFVGRPFPAQSLGDELHADFAELRVARSAVDDRIEEYVASLDESRLLASFTFTPLTSPRPRIFPLWVVVSHMFNHQTHHRGQLTALIEQAGGDCGVTDLLQLPGGNWGI